MSVFCGVKEDAGCGYDVHSLLFLVTQAYAWISLPSSPTETKTSFALPARMIFNSISESPPNSTRDLLNCSATSLVKALFKEFRIRYSEMDEGFSSLSTNTVRTREGSFMNCPGRIPPQMAARRRFRRRSKSNLMCEITGSTFTKLSILFIPLTHRGLQGLNRHVNNGNEYTTKNHFCQWFFQHFVFISV